MAIENILASPNPTEQPSFVPFSGEAHKQEHISCNNDTKMCPNWYKFVAKHIVHFTLVNRQFHALTLNYT